MVSYLVAIAMDIFDEIKSTIAGGSGKCVVLQEEEPVYVAMTWHEYEKLEKLIEALHRSVDIDINEIPIIE